MKLLVITVCLFIFAYTGFSQTAFVYSEVDPYWKAHSTAYWKGAKGFGNRIPGAMINRIENIYREISNDLSSESYKAIRQVTAFKVIERSPNPTALFPNRKDILIDVRSNIRVVHDKYPFYKKELGTEFIAVIYTFTVFKCNGDRILVEEVEETINKEDFKKEFKHLQDYEKNVEGYRFINSATLKKAMQHFVSKLEKNALFHENVAKDVQGDDYAKKFNDEISLLFEDRKNRYPNHYSFLPVSSLATRGTETEAAAAPVTDGSQYAVQSDIELSQRLGATLRKVTNHALFIGVNRYFDPTINSLENPINDAKVLLDVLVSRYTFEKNNVILLENPTRSDIIGSLDILEQKVQPADNLVIFYAGHGLWDEKLKKGYWLPADAQQGNRSNWFSNSDLQDYIGGIKSKHTLLIADACFSGGIFKTRDAFSGVTKSTLEIYKLPSRKAMTSGAMKTVPDKSVFLEYLVKRLVENNSLFLSSEELFASFKTAVINNSPNGQVPQFGDIHGTGDEGGDFIFMKRY